MERLLVVRCPDLLEEREHGREARAFTRVFQAMETFSPLVETIRPGIGAFGTRGPSRYFGGEEALAWKLSELLRTVDGLEGARGRPCTAMTPGVAIADGLFAAVLAASDPRAQHEPVIVPPGDSSSFLSHREVSALDRPELADILRRLGIRTLGEFAALPSRHVLARFGVEGEICHRVARGTIGELPGLRQPTRHPHGARPRAEEEARVRQPGFWGGAAEADSRASAALARVEQLLGPESVLFGRLQGGRGPGDRARLVPWVGGQTAAGPDAGTGSSSSRNTCGAPWPGRVPSPAPAKILRRPLPVELRDEHDAEIVVDARGSTNNAPSRLSIDHGPWKEVRRWAGPWPADERWWASRLRRRRARMQVVTSSGNAHLLVVERGHWLLEGSYD